MELGLRNTAQLFGGVGVEIAVTAADRAERDVNIGVERCGAVWCQL